MRTPFLSTALSADGRGLKKRFEKILCPRVKGVGIPSIAASAAMLFLLSSACSMTESVGIIGGADGPTAVYVSDSKSPVERAVSAAIFSENEGGYFDGEVSAEGHIILEEARDRLYVLLTYGEYGFENGKMVKQSGTGITPAVMYYSEDDGEYTVTSVKYPRDGSYYTDDIRDMFPKKYWARCTENSSTDYNDCLLQERAYVQAYLNQIGRQAEIAEHADASTLTDLGVSAEVSNRLMEIKDIPDFNKYPYTVGNREYIENGTRVVYSLSYSRGADDIVYEKTEYDTGDMLERYVFSAKTGEITESAARAERVGKD